MRTERRQSGVSLIELIVFIIVISVGIAGILSVFQLTVVLAHFAATRTPAPRPDLVSADQVDLPVPWIPYAQSVSPTDDILAQMSVLACDLIVTARDASARWTYGTHDPCDALAKKTYDAIESLYRLHDSYTRWQPTLDSVQTLLDAWPEPRLPPPYCVAALPALPPGPPEPGASTPSNGDSARHFR